MSRRISKTLYQTNLSEHVQVACGGNSLLATLNAAHSTPALDITGTDTELFECCQTPKVAWRRRLEILNNEGLSED